MLSMLVQNAIDPDNQSEERLHSFQQLWHQQGVSKLALLDHQTQLMLLEQQEKKWLTGQPGLPQAMSPQGSGSGPSLNLNDQMKCKTPKMSPSGLRGPPLPDGGMAQGRASPTAMYLGVRCDQICSSFAFN